MEQVAHPRERVERFRSVFDDERAFNAWYDDVLPRVFGYLYKRCGGDRVLTEELTQETFAEAVRTREGFDGRSGDATWLVSIARHKLIDHYRALARAERRRLVLLQGRQQEVHEPVSAWERRADVIETLRRLPAMQRAVLVLHYLDGLAVSEIAPALGKSEAAVQTLMTRARHRFRWLLESTEANDE